jgi:hypothetical protein
MYHHVDSIILLDVIPKIKATSNDEYWECRHDGIVEYTYKNKTMTSRIEFIDRHQIPDNSSKKCNNIFFINYDVLLGDNLNEDNYFIYNDNTKINCLTYCDGHVCTCDYANAFTWRELTNITVIFIFLDVFTYLIRVAWTNVSEVEENKIKQKINIIRDEYDKSKNI